MELWVRALRDPAVNAARERLDARWRAAIADVVREGQAAGEFGDGRPGDVRADARRADGRVRDPARAADPAVTPELVQEHCMALVEERLGLEGVHDGG